VCIVGPWVGTLALAPGAGPALKLDDLCERHQRLAMPSVPCPPERAIGCSYGGSVAGERSAWRERCGKHASSAAIRTACCLDDGEPMDDHLAHDERGLFPTGGIERKPGWQGDRGRHRTPHVTHLEALAAQHERSCQTVPEAHVAELSRELLQQRLGLLPVGRVEALGEPAVDRREHLLR
jgi:hypothetical protein